MTTININRKYEAWNTVSEWEHLYETLESLNSDISVVAGSVGLTVPESLVPFGIGNGIATDTNFSWNNVAKNLSVHGDGAATEAIFGHPLQEPGTWLANHYFSAPDAGNHVGSGHGLIGCYYEPVGSTLNGPLTSDYVLLLSCLKKDWTVSTVDGQIGAANIMVRQGLFGDADAFDINVAGYGTMFYAAMECVTLTCDPNNNNILEEIDVQICVTNRNNTDCCNMGYFTYLAVKNSNSEAFRADCANGTEWTNFLHFISDGVEISKLTGTGDFHIPHILINAPISASADRRLEIKQTEGAAAVLIQRGTDTSPTSHFIECTNSTQTADRFVVTAVEPGVAETSMFLAYHNGSTVTCQPVTVGGDDSGGSGYKLLRVPN